MSKIDISVGDLFMKLGATPASRSAKASSLFRRLRAEDEREIQKALMRGAARIDLGAATPDKPETSD